MISNKIAALTLKPLRLYDWTHGYWTYTMNWSYILTILSCQMAYENSSVTPFLSTTL